VPDPAELAGEDDLLAGIGAGDSGIFARWLALSEGRLRDSLRPFAARVDVEAVLQESLVRVWQVAPRFVPDGRPDALLRLAIRIARNLAVSELRRSRVDFVDPEFLERVLSDAPGMSTGPDRGSDPILRRAIEECRRMLPRKPAEAIQARIDSGGAEPDAVLAERLRMRRNTFLQNITRARRLLADCLRRRGIDLAMELS
jgi:DNA-directed RNA polymerase specialized sigma24 family protein